MTTSIAALLTESRAALAAEYTNWAGAQVKRLIEKYPTFRCRSEYRDDYMLISNLQGCVSYDSNFMDAKASLDEARLAKQAEKFATYQIERWEAKIIEKLGRAQIVDGRVDTRGDLWIKAELDGKTVFLDQHRVFKFSNRGTPFYQFPARLRLDGKAITAAAFKKLAS